MSGFPIDTFVRTAGAAALGRTLLHSLWEGAVVALALAIVLSVARGPRLRYAAACAAMVATLAGMVVTFVRLAPAAPVVIRVAGNHATHIPAVPITWQERGPVEQRPIDERAWL